MSSSPLLALIARCRALGRPRSQSADAELLARFTHHRDAAAFEELLERYAPLVWSACRRIALTEADAEDAFQAAFLALVRQAGRLDDRQPLGGWLHTVAVRVARRGRSLRQRNLPCLGEPTTQDDVADEVGSRELLRVVDEEIDRLPPLLRAPLLLCCLQGRTRDEAAQTLACSVSAVKSRLERGRNLLRVRLESRGVQLPVAFLVLGLTGQRIRAALWAKTMQSVLHTPAAMIVALSEAALPALTVGKCKLISAALLVAVSAVGVAGTVLRAKVEEKPLAAQQVKPATETKKPQAPQVRTDRHSDPLPDGAIARLGTVRWRHGFLIHALAYSPDGKKIAAVGGGRAITLWDAATGKEIHQFPNRNQPNAVAFSPDGKILATAGSPTCRLWDVASGKELRQLKGHTNGLRSVAFAPDGNTLATSSYDGTARIWDTNTGKEMRCLDCKKGYLNAAVYSPDGKLLAAGGQDSTIRLWDAATARERRQLQGHKKAIGSLAFSPDGKHLASSSEDETIRLWDAVMGRQVRVFEEKSAGFAEKSQGIRSPIAFSPDSSLLVFGRRDGTICLWETASGNEKRRWQGGSGMDVEGLAFSPDGKTLASASWDGSIRLWDVAAGREKNPSDEHRGYIALLRFLPRERALISMGGDNRLLSWDLVTNTPRQRLSYSAERPGGCALSAGGDILTVDGWPDSHLRLWNVRTGKPGRALGKPQKRPIYTACAISPDGRLVAAQGDDKAIHIWDTAGGKEVRQLKGFGDKVWHAMTFSPDGKVLAGGTWEFAARERAVCLWDVSNGKEIRSLAGVGPIYALAFSPSGSVLAVGDSGGDYAGFVRLWDIATGKELCRHTGHFEMAGPITFSPDGKLVASGTGMFGLEDNSVHVWEAATGRLLRRFAGHHSQVGSVEFAQDGLAVASGGGDSTILLWDITGSRSDGRWHPKPLAPGQLDACWTAMANEDAAKAYEAVWTLVAAPEQAVPFLQKHLSPAPRPDAKLVARLIADLNSADFMVRQKATEELSKLDDAITSAVRRALDGKPALEVRRRLQQLLDQTRDWTAERLRRHRAIQALEHMGTPQAKEVLQTLAEGAPESRRTEESKAALRRWLR